MTVRSRLFITALAALLVLSGAALAGVVANADPLNVAIAGGCFLAGVLISAALERPKE